MQHLLKLALITASLLLGYEQYMLRIATLDNAALTVAYVALFGLMASALYIAAFIDYPVLRWFWALVLGVSCIAYDANTRIMGTGLTYDTFILLAKSMGFAKAAMEQYAGAILASLPAGLLLFVGIAWPPRPSRSGRSIFGHRAAKLTAGVYPLLIVGVFSALLFVRGGNGSNGLPAAYIPLSLSALYTYDVLAEQHGERQQVSLKQRVDKGQDQRDIVFIIDESLRGDYLDINHPNGELSNLASNPPQGRVFNFGLAASATNCSEGTNLILRFGGTRTAYMRHINVMPSVWQYAHAAGYRAVYLDAQSEAHLYNGMVDAEIKQIDDFIQFKDVPPLHRDQAAAKKLAELINDGQKQFILVNKLGAHFPIHDKYPDEFLKHQPALPRGEFKDAAPIVKTIFGSAETDWERYKNSYKNTVRWVVGAFFDTLFQSADLNKAVILYTSDHGQTFHERNNPGENTHCSSDPAMEEGLVPMVAITGSQPGQDPGFAAMAEQNFNKTTHFSVFPTLLDLMGFDPAEVKQLYGTPLTAPMTEPFAFNARFAARLGQPPLWKTIDLEKVVYPPP